jgi:hypothetical protein
MRGLTPQKRTILGLAIVAVLLLILEGLSFLWGGNSTISETMWGLLNNPLIALAVGALIGHIAWQSQEVYSWARGEIDYVRRGALEKYHEHRNDGIPEKSVLARMIEEGDIKRYGGLK